MNKDNVPMATILCLFGICLIGIAGDAVILIIAPHPITVASSTWWGVIGLGVVHHFGAGAVAHYSSAVHLPPWQQILAWAHQHPGYWRWISVARYWWLVAFFASVGFTLWWVWRTPASSDQHRRGTRIASDQRAYRQLINQLKNERD
jgi:hypothetical protein